MNMQAVTVYLKKLSEQNPSASYYNVDVLKYQVTLCLLLVVRAKEEFKVFLAVFFVLEVSSVNSYSSHRIMSPLTPSSINIL